MFILEFDPLVHAETDSVQSGARRGWNPLVFDELLFHAEQTLLRAPHEGECHLLDGVEVYTLHLRQPGNPALHQFLYRVRRNRVEVAHLLHEALPIHRFVPREWRTRAAAA